MFRMFVSVFCQNTTHVLFGAKSGNLEAKGNFEVMKCKQLLNTRKATATRVAAHTHMKGRI